MIKYTDFDVGRKVKVRKTGEILFMFDLGSHKQTHKYTGIWCDNEDELGPLKFYLFEELKLVKEK